MEKLITLEAVAAALPFDNLDTDQLMPKQFLRGIDKSGLAKGMLYNMRHRPDGTVNPDFILNRPGHEKTKILVAGPNFGCGSSREHAPWALLDWGVRVVISESFGDIFKNNALGNGLLTVELPEAQISEIFDALYAHPGMTVTVSLETMTVEAAGKTYPFTLDPFRRRCIMEGLDAISLTLEHEDEIAAFEAKRPAWANRNE